MNKKLVPVILLSLIGFGSCTKTARPTAEPTPIDSTTFYTYSMSSIYNSLKNVPKIVNFDPSLGGTIVGNSGTVYTFPANAFQTATGGTVTGTISLSLTEYIEKGDMIFSRVLPYSNGDPLISGGELSVQATQSGSKLFIRPGFTFTAAIPQRGVISNNMLEFYGETMNNSTNPVNWTTGLGLGTASTFGDTVTINSDSAGYISAGKFFTSPNYQAITLSVNGVTFDDSDHVQAYAVYDNYRAVYPLASRYHQKFTDTHVASFPLHFVVYTVYHGDFYAGISTNSVTPLNGGGYSVTLTKQNPITFLHTVNNM